ncbi:MAG: imidazole glycerol phosphate synthase subunit HisH [Actinomycetota bacterium]
MRAGIVDYRMGNLASVSKALERVGAESFVSGDPELLETSDLLVLPGVGNFAAGMGNLSRLGLAELVIDWAGEGRPLLGICMGMQLLFDWSEEGDTEGLGILPGKVVRLPGSVKVPHMGWNTIRASSDLFLPLDGRRFYFVHSYVCVPEGEEAAAITDYGGGFASAVESGNAVGVQFHPEKSSADGLALLRRLLEAER